MGALTRIVASTWGASFIRARQIYTAMICPTLSYGAAIWHSPSPLSCSRPKGVAAKLQTIQFKCLHTIAGAYRATPIHTLETETFIPPLDLHLDGRVKVYHNRMRHSRAEEITQKACWQIQCRTRKFTTAITATQTIREKWAADRASQLEEMDLIGPKDLVQAAWLQ